MQIDSTMISIIEDICTNGSLSILELESKYNFTKRQLRYCIEKIDEYLMSEGFNLIVKDFSQLIMKDVMSSWER